MHVFFDKQLVLCGVCVCVCVCVCISSLQFARTSPLLTSTADMSDDTVYGVVLIFE